MSSQTIREQSLAERKRRIDTNPCFDEQKKSLKCIELNVSDGKNCEREVENVKICKAFWYRIESFRKSNRIVPNIPVPEDRAHMKAIYMKTGSVNAIIEDMKKQYDL